MLMEAAQQWCTCVYSFEWAEGYTKPFGMYAWRPDGSKDRELKVLWLHLPAAGGHSPLWDVVCFVQIYCCHIVVVF